MRIAVLAHVRQPVAAPFAGGMESHCWHLCAGLEARGHRVTLFASGDSDPRFDLRAVVPVHLEAAHPGAEHRGDPALIAANDAAYARACDDIAAGGFDVVHNNSLHRFPLAREATARVPTLTSLHVPPYAGLHWFVANSIAPGHRLTATSASHLAAWWPGGAPDSAGVLHNGIDPTRWPFDPAPRPSPGALWCGRIVPDKAPHLALRAARLADMPITLVGAVEDPAYFAREVAPLLGGDARYLGHVDAPALVAAMAAASVFVFTPDWDEPFGLAIVEAMACGLPVAAFDRGAVREVVGDAGRLAAAGDVAALADAIRAAAAIPRSIPRMRVEARFGEARWLDGCEALYRAAIADAGAAA